MAASMKGSTERFRPIDGFLQQVPQEGAPATEPTEMWVFFDDENIYVAARCLDSQPERIIANELRRDSNAIFQNDNFGVVLDTFFDQRNGYYFQTNALGALRDAAVNESGNNSNWSTVWDVRTARFEHGYTVEMVIPFKSLRYRGAGPQTWGINARRVVSWKNESSMLSQVPASYAGGWTQMALAGPLEGLETPAQALNLELKPYGVSSVTTDRAARVPFTNDVESSGGFDLKYGLTRALTADMTVHTDFAQVEEDLQQVNLTRFDVFYPEKRDFFLEGQGIFDFGGQAGFSARTATVPIMFFSRRVGLSNGQSVPVIAGGRLTGKAGKFDVGGLVITTDDKPAAGAVQTTFSATRVRRNILRRSSVGFIATSRSPAATARISTRRPASTPTCASIRTSRPTSTGPAPRRRPRRSRKAAKAGAMITAIGRAFSTAATAMGSKSIASSSGPTSTPKWDSSAAGTWR